MLFGTTRVFLERLGLDSLADLPRSPTSCPTPTRRGARARAARVRRPARRTRTMTTRTPTGRPGSSAEGERLQKVLAAGRASGRGALRGADRRRAGHGRRRGRDARRARRPATRRASRSTACRSSSTPTLVHWLLNKPAGSSRPPAIPQGRPTVLELVPREPRVFPVGRLDSTPRAARPHQRRRPRAAAHAPEPRRREGRTSPRSRACRSAATRCGAARGRRARRRPTAPARVRLVQRPGDSAALEIVINEGRNRMCGACAKRSVIRCVRLVRTRIGPLTDRRLAPGEWRALRTRRGAGAVRRRGRSPQRSRADDPTPD